MRTPRLLLVLAPVLLLALLPVLAGNLGRADACACCDSSLRRAPVGWTQAGGAVLVEVSGHVGCEPLRYLEVWPVGAVAPSGCYDLLGDPDLRIACDRVTSEPADATVRTSTQARRFPRTASALPAHQVRVEQRRPAAPARATGPDEATIVVTAKLRGRWQRVWAGAVASDAAVHGADGDESAVEISATVWPSPRGDRALLIVHHRRADGGHWDGATRWIELAPVRGSDYPSRSGSP